MTRRSWLGLLVTFGASIVGGVIAIPALVTALSPALPSRRQRSWRSIGRLRDYQIGMVHEGQVSSDPQAWPRPVRNQAVFVWRPNESDLVVSRGAAPIWVARWTTTGQRLLLLPLPWRHLRAGWRSAWPARRNRPMHRYAHRVRDGVLEIDVASIPPAPEGGNQVISEVAALGRRSLRTRADLGPCARSPGAAKIRGITATAWRCWSC